MKKFILGALLGVAALGASAEGLYVGGQVGFWHESSNNSVAKNQLTILPEIGYDVDDTWSVGTQIGYDYTHLCGLSTSVNLFQFNPYARYTFYKSKNNFVHVFVDGTVGIGAGWTSYDTDGHSSSKTAVTYQIGVRPGVKLNFNDHLSFVAHIGMLGYKGANNQAKLGGYKSQGGLLINSNDLEFGVSYSF